MNELQRNLVRIEELLEQGAISGAKHALWQAQEHARSSESLINAQTHSMTELSLKVKALAADSAMYKERMAYWEKRARSAEEDARNIIPSAFKVWWAMVESDCELQNSPLNDSDIALNYMGNGASCYVTTGEIRKMLGEPDDTLDNLRTHGLEDHLTGSDSDA